jgi:hypothetical protein
MLIQKTPFTLFEPFETTRKGVIRKRALRYDLNALADFEQEVGMGFAQLMQMKALFATARALLWAGLKHEDRTLTIESVGNLMSIYIREHNGDINTVLSACFGAAMDQGALGRPDQDEDEEPETAASVPKDFAATVIALTPVAVTTPDPEPTT